MRKISVVGVVNWKSRIQAFIQAYGVLFCIYFQWGRYLCTLFIMHELKMQDRYTVATSYHFHSAVWEPFVV